VAIGAPRNVGAASRRRAVSPPSVSAIVVTYNCADYVGRCLESLARSSTPMDVVVVDNGSADGTAGAVRRGHPAVAVIEQENVGYAGGNNTGFDWARRRGSRYAFVVNPDVAVGPRCVERLVEFMDGHDRSAIASPKIHYPDGRTIWFAGASIDWTTGATPHRGMGQIDSGQFDEVQTMDRTCGAAMLVRMSAVERIGPMPDDYFLYFEETEWSRRFIAEGFELHYVPAAECVHAASSSTGENSPLVWYYLTRNNLLFMSRCGQAHWATFDASFRRRCSSIVKGWLRRPSAGNLRRAWAVIKGQRDFAAGRFGRRW
jgi:GT2 family glycosyltransferase